MNLLEKTKRMGPRTTLCVHPFRNGNILKEYSKKSCCKLIITEKLRKGTGHCEASPQRNLKSFNRNRIYVYSCKDEANETKLDLVGPYV